MENYTFRKNSSVARMETLESRGITKAQFTDLALKHGFSVRYSGKTRVFHLAPVSVNFKNENDG